MDCSLPGSSVHGVFQARILVFFLGASLMAQTVKNLPAMQETLVQSLGWEVSTLLGPQSQVQESCLFWMQALSCGHLTVAKWCLLPSLKDENTETLWMDSSMPPYLQRSHRIVLELRFPHSCPVLFILFFKDGDMAFLPPSFTEW